METTQRICSICNEPISPEENRNRKVHDYCEKARKDETNSARAEMLRPLNNLVLRLDRILKKYHPLSQGVTAINKEVLDREGFAWDFNVAITGRNPHILWVLEYGYSITNKSKIIIHHGGNPLQ